MTTACPSPEELARMVSERATSEMVAHLGSCEACSLEWESGNQLRGLARSLQAETPLPEEVGRVRARVMATALLARRRRRMQTPLFVALAMAAGAALAIGLRGPARAPSGQLAAARYHGTVVGSNGAEFSHPSGIPDEVVQLTSGTIHVEVSPLGPGERFRVRTPDGEVEVRGTAFDVTVDAGHMSRVAVDHGRVEVRGGGAPLAVLSAGEKWNGATVPGATNHADEIAPASGSASDDLAGSAAESAHSPSEAPAPHAEALRDSRERPATSKASPPAPEGSAAPAVVPSPEHAEVAARSVVAVPSAPSTAPLPPPAKTALPNAAPTTNAAPAPADDERTREDRRERRDERRERYDQRRMR